jgi:hypothetical protein
VPTLERRDLPVALPQLYVMAFGQLLGAFHSCRIVRAKKVDAISDVAVIAEEEGLVLLHSGKTGSHNWSRYRAKVQK